MAEQVSERLWPLATNCAVCLDNIMDPPCICCGHEFCFICLYIWSEVHPSCPICRQSYNEILMHNCPSPTDHSIRNCENIMRHPVFDRTNDMEDLDDSLLEGISDGDEEWEFEEGADTDIDISSYGGREGRGGDFQRPDIRRTVEWEGLQVSYDLVVPDVAPRVGTWCDYVIEMNLGKTPLEIFRKMSGPVFSPDPDYLRQMDIYRVLYMEYLHKTNQYVDLQDLDGIKERVLHGSYAYSKSEAAQAERQYLLQRQFSVERQLENGGLSYSSQPSLLVKDPPYFQLNIYNHSDLKMSYHRIFSDSFHVVNTNLNASAVEVERLAGVYFPCHEHLQDIDMYRIVLFSKLDLSHPNYNEDTYWDLIKKADTQASHVFDPYPYLPKATGKVQVLSRVNPMPICGNERLQVQQKFLSEDGKVLTIEMDAEDAKHCRAFPTLSSYTILRLRRQAPPVSLVPDLKNDIEKYQHVLKECTK